MNLFYSYCHVDERFREALEKHVAVLKSNGEITDWCDRRLAAGQEFQKEIDSQLETADIIILSISSDFFASDACMNEMQTALHLQHAKRTTVIPLIIRPCDWLHSAISDLLVLPEDGKPVSEWSSRDAAFLDVVTGIRGALSKSRPSSPAFKLREEYIDMITETDFISQSKGDVRIDDVFVFPNIINEAAGQEQPIRHTDEVMAIGNNVMIKGDYRSGKTTVCTKLFLERATTGTPALMVTGSDLSTSLRHHDLTARKFGEQYTGSFPEWDKLDGKILIVDDLVANSNLNFIAFAKNYFQTVIITLSEDDYLAFFKDEKELANFHVLTIKEMSHPQQQDLIRKWKGLKSNGGVDARIPDGVVDELEDRLNSIVLDKKVVPRYSFYVLSILQTYEGFMPPGIQITAFGHCYHALITAQIISTGVRGEDVDSVFNFLSHFAYFLLRTRRECESLSFDQFVSKYKAMFVIKEGVVSRIVGGHRPFLRRNGPGYDFRYPYVYYFLLGYYFARNPRERDLHINEIVENSFVRDNTFILIFSIHHAYDEFLIERILECTTGAMEEVVVGTLEKEEVNLLEDALLEVPKNILSRLPVDVERRIEREGRDQVESIGLDSDVNEHSDVGNELVNDVLRALKNMEIMGQILRNKYGSLSRERLKEIVRTIGDAGLRLVSSITSRESILKFEDVLVERIGEIQSEGKRVEVEDVRKGFRALVIVLVLSLVERISESIGRKELDVVVKEVVREQGTTAYQLIGAFHALGVTEEVEGPLVERLARLLSGVKKKKNWIAHRLISLRVQRYLNTHWIRERLRQRLFGMLGLAYKPNAAKSQRRGG